MNDRRGGGRKDFGKAVAIWGLLGWAAFAPAGWAQEATTTTSRAATAWLDLATSQPIAFSNTHEIVIEPAGGGMRVIDSQWRLRRLAMRIFKGEVWIEGDGRIAGGAAESVATTVTLRGVDAREAMEFFALPRRGEVEGRISGSVSARLEDGQWSAVTVALTAEPGSVQVSRKLLQDLLSSSLGQAVTPAKLTATLNQFFGSKPMIPFAQVSLTGELNQDTLQLTLPLKNEALNLELNPRIEKALLWDMWNYLRQRLRIGTIDKIRMAGEDK